MAMPESPMRDWERLSVQNQQQAQSYIHLLLARQSGLEQRENSPRRLGILADRFHGIAEDFNDPLPEFEAYLE